MSVIVFFKDWVKSVLEIFSKYPLAASIVTIVAVLAWLHLQRERNHLGKRSTTIVHTFVVLLGWLIVVPILGSVIDAVMWIAKTALAAASFAYHSYVAHPFFVIGVAFLTLVAYAIWEWRVTPRRPVWRATVALVCALGVVGVGAAVLDKLPPSSSAPTPTAQTTPVPDKPSATPVKPSLPRGTVSASVIGKK